MLKGHPSIRRRVTLESRRHPDGAIVQLPVIVIKLFVLWKGALVVAAEHRFRFILRKSIERASKLIVRVDVVMIIEGAIVFHHQTPLACQTSVRDRTVTSPHMTIRIILVRDIDGGGTLPRRGRDSQRNDLVGLVHTIGYQVSRTSAFGSLEILGQYFFQS